MKRFAGIFILFIVSVSLGVTQSKKGPDSSVRTSLKNDTLACTSTVLITFVELGSVNCIPCRAMQPIMKSVEEKYAGRVKVIFYDVWKREQAHYAQDYSIRIIPTQVFLDTAGKELMRHEGFLPEEEIDAFLKSQGLRTKVSLKE